LAENKKRDALELAARLDEEHHAWLAQKGAVKAAAAPNEVA